MATICMATITSLGAVNGTRTRDPRLGKPMLYQLSYYRVLLAKIQYLFGKGVVVLVLFSIPLAIILYPLQATSCHFLSYTTILQEILFNAVKVML